MKTRTDSPESSFSLLLKNNLLEYSLGFANGSAVENPPALQKTQKAWA